MMDLRTSAVQYAHAHRPRFLQELQQWIRIPSISTAPDYKEEMQRAAEWIAAQLGSIGMQKTAIYSTPKHPIVFSEHRCNRSNAPTILIYGHYDVQPAEPLELWQSNPFEPTVRGENLYGRGASDMKGQVMAAVKAVESALRQGELSLHIKFLIEGEEEIGSPNLSAFLKEHSKQLKATVALNPDSGMISPETPTITYGLRGLSYFELRVYGPEHDLHSGLYGGVIHNPAQVLCELIAGMHDAKGRVTLPGFYDRVKPLDQEERQQLARLPVGADFYKKQTGVPELWGEEGYTPIERIGARPTLEVNGLLSGYTGTGSKTVLPSWAMAKISMRLVPEQDASEVHDQLIAYLKEHAPNTVRWEVEPLSHSPASITDRNHPATQALSAALQTVWGVPPVYKREGGSIAVVADMQSILGIESVLTGFGLLDDQIHAPNEKLHLPTWYRGIDALIHFLYNIGSD